MGIEEDIENVKESDTEFKLYTNGTQEHTVMLWHKRIVGHLKHMFFRKGAGTKTVDFVVEIEVDDDELGNGK